MSGGWIKLNRGPATDELLSDPKLFALLALIALRARWNDTPSIHGLEIGEAFIGDHETAGLTRQEYRSRMQKLKSLGFSTTKPTNRGTIVKLINTGVFNPLDDSSNQQTNHPATNKQPLTKKEKTKRHSSSSASAEGLEFADWFLTITDSKLKLIPTWREQWGGIYDEMIRLDGRTATEIRAVCEWARKDDFWKNNFMTPMKLRARDKSGVKYFDVFKTKLGHAKTNPGSATASPHNNNLNRDAVSDYSQIRKRVPLGLGINGQGNGAGSGGTDGHVSPGNPVQQ